MKAKIFFTLISYWFVFTLGAYSASEFAFNRPIETYRWFVSSVGFVLFIILSNKKIIDEKK